MPPREVIVIPVQIDSPHRITCVDLSKTLAIMGVLLIHCTANRFGLFPVDSGPWIANSFWSILGRWAVPLFLICSGALMNDPERDVPIKRLFSKYILRLVAAFTLWAGFYELVRIYLQLGSAPIVTLVKQAAADMLYSNTFYHLYYFYFVLLLYLALPMTRIIAAHTDQHQLGYIIGLWLLMGSVFPFLKVYPVFQAYQSGFLWLSLGEIFICPALGLLGWYMRKYPPKNRHLPALVFLLSIGAAFAGLLIRSHRIDTLDYLFIDAFNPAIVLAGASVFRMTQCIHLSPAGASAARFISLGSFCVYLVHPFFQQFLTSFHSGNPLWAAPAQAGMLLVISLLTYSVMKHIPIVNRWLI